MRSQRRARSSLVAVWPDVICQPYGLRSTPETGVVLLKRVTISVRARQGGCANAGFFRDVSTGSQHPIRSLKIFLPFFRKICFHPARPDSTRRGVSADRHERGKLDAMDVPALRDEQGRADERNRAVPTPRRWRQASRETFARATEANKPGTPGRPRISRKPSRRECRLIRLNLWSLPPAFLFAGGPWVRPAPGIPCALLFQEGDAGERNSVGLPSRERDVLPPSGSLTFE